jgi:hypothetical protein
MTTNPEGVSKMQSLLLSVQNSDTNSLAKIPIPVPVTKSPLHRTAVQMVEEAIDVAEGLVRGSTSTAPPNNLSQPESEVFPSDMETQNVSDVARGQEKVVYDDLPRIHLMDEMKIGQTIAFKVSSSMLKGFRFIFSAFLYRKNSSRGNVKVKLNQLTQLWLLYLNDSVR